jgi:nucleotide-binding universal stress UspA family protein
MMADIIVLNVVNIREMEALKIAASHSPEQINFDDYVKRTKADRFRRVQELVSEHFSPDSNNITIFVEIGVPFKSILAVIDREKIDLVVQGNKGRGNVVGTLLGSHAEKVFRHSPVPVLSIRNEMST